MGKNISTKENTRNSLTIFADNFEEKRKTSQLLLLHFFYKQLVQKTLNNFLFFLKLLFCHAKGKDKTN